MTGFEPATSGTTIRRSNQLSYTHHEGMYRIEKGEQILSEGLKARKHMGHEISAMPTMHFQGENGFILHHCPNWGMVFS